MAIRKLNSEFERYQSRACVLERVPALLETRENESLIVRFDFFIEQYSWLISDMRFNVQFAIYVTYEQMADLSHPHTCALLFY
jgi:hypothetical protein